MKRCPVWRTMSLLFAYDVFLLAPSKVDLQHALEFLLSFSAMCELGRSDGEAGSEFLEKALCLPVSQSIYLFSAIVTRRRTWSQIQEAEMRFLWLLDILSVIG